MGGWKLESFKMLAYLSFPVGAFVYFNHPNFYEKSLKQTLELVSRDVNFENLAKYEQMNSKGEIDKLGGVIEELENDNNNKLAKGGGANAPPTTVAVKPSAGSIAAKMQSIKEK